MKRTAFLCNEVGYEAYIQIGKCLWQHELLSSQLVFHTGIKNYISFYQLNDI